MEIWYGWPPFHHSSCIVIRFHYIHNHCKSQHVKTFATWMLPCSIKKNILHRLPNPDPRRNLAFPCRVSSCMHLKISVIQPKTVPYTWTHPVTMMLESMWEVLLPSSNAALWKNRGCWLDWNTATILMQRRIVGLSHRRPRMDRNMATCLMERRSIVQFWKPWFVSISCAMMPFLYYEYGPAWNHDLLTSLMQSV